MRIRAKELHRTRKRAEERHKARALAATTQRESKAKSK